MSESTSPRRSRPSRSLIIIVSLSIIAAAALVYSLWSWRAVAAAAQVQLVAGPGPIRCNDGVLPIRLGDEDDQPAVAIRLNAKRGAWCQVPISVRNNSSHTITVHDMTFQMARSGSSAAGAIVVTSDGSGVGPVGSKESMDAVFTIGERVGPGESSTSLMRVETNPHACQDEGLWSIFDVPLVRFSVLHREHEVRGAINLQGNVGSKGLTWSGCGR